METERKFLVTDPAEAEGGERTRIEQGYLTMADAGAEVRLRRRDGERLLTVKGGTGMTRSEVEVDITEEQFDELWPLTEGRRVVKSRSVVPAGELEIEVDVFEGPLQGLAVAEVEFEDEDAASAFEPPDWLGDEVTGDERYLNETLATEGVPTEGD